MPRLFGTDGVRGIANVDLTPELALRLGRAGAYYLASSWSKRGRPFIVLGRDSRLSGDLFTAAVVAGACSVGVDVVDLGILPTPAVAYLARTLGAAGGAVISASHNPVDDNGVKFFDAHGFKLTAEAEEEIESHLGSRPDRLPRPAGGGVGRKFDGREHVRAYADHVLASAGGEGCLAANAPGLTVVVDAAYGATAGLASEVVRRAGARVVAMNDVAEGSRINVDCGSTNPEPMARRVAEVGAAAGLAFDGDGDRVIACDETGKVVDGDQIMAILALDLASRRGLAKKTVVATVMSNFGLDLALREAGVKVVRAAVGDRNVLQEMLQVGAVLGGEQSGHVILLRHTTTGDGLLTGLHLLSVMARSGRKLSELAGRVVKLPQVLINVNVTKKDKLQTSEKVATAIERVREALGHTGSVVVRASGTEPVVRIMVEGRDERRIEEMARDLARVVAEELGGEIAREPRDKR